MDAEASAALQQLRDGAVEVFEVASQRAEPVDQQHDIGRGELRQAPGGMGGAHLRQRIEAVIAEDVFAHCDHRCELLDEPLEAFAVAARGDAADVREVLQP